MGFIFKYVILFFENQLAYSYDLKIFYLILSVILSLIFYLTLSLFIRAFNSKDLKLKY